MNKFIPTHEATLADGVTVVPVRSNGDGTYSTIDEHDNDHRHPFPEHRVRPLAKPEPGPAERKRKSK